MPKKNTSIIPRKIARYGWKPDLPDQRDQLFAAPPARLVTLPPKIDLRPQCPKVYDQGQIGSCTANAIAGAIEFDLLKQKSGDFMPSRLFIYYNERDIEHTVSTDSGAQIRDGVKSVNKLGVCTETEWPYVATPADPNTSVWPAGAIPATRPPQACYKDALNNLATSYQRVNRDLAQFKGCLASGYPFVFGFTVYDSFESPQVARTGVLNLPTSTESVVGGHAVLCVGYDESTQRFTVRNSWGPKWGQKGYFTIPYAYLLSAQLASDFWTIRFVA